MTDPQLLRGIKSLLKLTNQIIFYVELVSSKHYNIISLYKYSMCDQN